MNRWDAVRTVAAAALITASAIGTVVAGVLVLTTEAPEPCLIDGVSAVAGVEHCPRGDGHTD